MFEDIGKVVSSTIDTMTDHLLDDEELKKIGSFKELEDIHQLKASHIDLDAVIFILDMGVNAPNQKIYYASEKKNYDKIIMHLIKMEKKNNPLIKVVLFFSKLSLKEKEKFNIISSFPELVKFIVDHQNKSVLLGNLIGLQFEKSEIKDLNLSRYRFDRTKFIKSMISQVNLEGATFLRSSIANSEFINVLFRNINFNKIKIQQTKLQNTSYERISFNDAELQTINFIACDMKDCDFSGAVLKDVKFSCFSENSSDLINWENINFRGAYLKNMEISYRKKGKVDFSRVTLESVILNGNDFSDTSFQFANIKQTNMEKVCLDNVSFKGAILNEVSFAYSKQNIYFKTEFSDAQLTDVKFIYSSLNQANFESAQLSKINFAGANLSKACFSKTNIQNSCFDSAQAMRAVFISAKLNDVSLVGIDLSFADLTNADLSNVNLENAKLDNVILNGANLKGANLKNAIFKQSKLINVNLENSTLINANFEETILSQVNFKNVNLSNANFDQVEMSRCNFLSINFSAVRMRDVVIYNCFLGEIDFQNAFFYHVQIERTKLKNINFTGAEFFGQSVIKKCTFLGHKNIIDKLLLPIMSCRIQSKETTFNISTYTDEQKKMIIKLFSCIYSALRAGQSSIYKTNFLKTIERKENEKEKLLSIIRHAYETHHKNSRSAMALQILDEYLVDDFKIINLSERKDDIVKAIFSYSCKSSNFPLRTFLTQHRCIPRLLEILNAESRPEPCDNSLASTSHQGSSHHC